MLLPKVAKIRADLLYSYNTKNDRLKNRVRQREMLSINYFWYINYPNKNRAEFNSKEPEIIDMLLSLKYMLP
jgi:hypothetical protein